MIFIKGGDKPSASALSNLIVMIVTQSDSEESQ
jgi:hypothetical protein